MNYDNLKELSFKNTTAKVGVAKGLKYPLSLFQFFFFSFFQYYTASTQKGTVQAGIGAAERGPNLVASKKDHKLVKSCPSGKTFTKRNPNTKLPIRGVQG